MGFWKNLFNRKNKKNKSINSENYVINNDEEEKVVNLEVVPVNNRCPYCRTELQGTISATKNGIKYVCCNNCSYVAKLEKGIIVNKETTIEEVNNAHKLFKEVGIEYNQYAISKNSERKSFKNMIINDFEITEDREKESNVIYLEDYREL